jgi:hypothetical protein
MPYSNEQEQILDLFPPDKFIRIQNVPIFKEHESEGNGGKPRKVTVKDLEHLAENCNHKFKNLRAATPLSLGHTSDEPNVKEKDQPEIVGWAVNFKVGDLLDTGKKALFTDWYIRKKHADVIEEYPHRSIEWYRSRGDINPISLLRTAPELDLPIIKYNKSYSDTDECYRYVFSPQTDNPIMNDDVNKAITDAQKDQTDGHVKLASEVADLQAQLAELKQMFVQLVEAISHEGDGEEDSEDGLMDPKEKESPEEPAEEESPEEDEEEEEAPKTSEKKDEHKNPKKEPSKFEAAYAGSNNVYTPNSEKKKMGREEDAVKFQRQQEIAEVVDRATATIRKENDDIRKQLNLSKAEKAVDTLEREHKVDFGRAEDRQEEVEMFAGLLQADKSGEAFNEYYNRVAKKYKRKEEKPNSAAVDLVNKYSRTEDVPSEFKSTDDVNAFISAWSQDNSLTPEKFLDRKNGVK